MDSGNELRKKKIDTAVKFLQNPRVRQTPMNQRRSFLEKKGLTKEEIDEAVSLSGTAADVQNSPSSAIAPSNSRPPAPPPPTHSIPWMGYFGAAVIGGGLGYLLINLVKTYVVPLIFNLQQKEEKLDQLEAAIVKTNANVTEAVGSVKTSLQSLQEILAEQRKMIQNLSSDLAQTQDKLAGLPTDSYSVGDLKSEIVSLKGLLLNRKQFPPAMIGSPQSPGIPAWQRSTTPSVVSAFPKDDKSSGNSQEIIDHSHINGDMNELETNKNQEGLSSGSSSSTCTPDTMKHQDSHMDASMMNDALIAEEGDVSNDTTVSSLSDLSANASFHEASIAFSSTCIKITASDELTMAETAEID